MKMNTNVMLGIGDVADFVVGLYKSAQKNGHKMPVVNLLGQTGIGKTSIVEEIAERLKIEFLLFDVPNLDLADAGIPMPNDDGTVTYFPNKTMGLHKDTVKVICLDELSKGNPMQVTMCHPLLAEKNKRFGNIPVHDNSVVILTGNRTAEGLGDKLKGHTLNRIVTIEIENTSADEWLENFAIPNNVHPLLMAWVKRTPQVMEFYGDLEDPSTNEFIWNPKIHNQSQKAFTTPRSLNTASALLWSYTDDFISRKMLEAGLEGCVGVSASKEIVTFLKHYKEIPSPEDIRENWQSAVMPTSAPSQMLVAMAGLAWVESTDDLDKFIQYLSQPNFMSTEGVAVFMKSAGTPKKDLNAPLFKATTRSAHFQKWALDNRHLFSNL